MRRDVKTQESRPRFRLTKKSYDCIPKMALKPARMQNDKKSKLVLKYTYVLPDTCSDVTIPQKRILC